MPEPSTTVPFLINRSRAIRRLLAITTGTFAARVGRCQSMLPHSQPPFVLGYASDSLSAWERVGVVAYCKPPRLPAMMAQSAMGGVDGEGHPNRGDGFLGCAGRRVP